MWATLLTLCFLGAMVAGLIGISSMLVAFGLVAKHGSWEAAMRSGPGGKSSAARRLMVFGAGLNTFVAFTLLVLLTVMQMLRPNS